MYDSDLRYKLPISEILKNPQNFHFSSYTSKKVKPGDKHYHAYNNSPEVEEEYQQITDHNNIIKGKALINLTSEELTKEYSEKYNYYYQGLKHILFISIIIILCSLIEFKYLEPSDFNLAILIISCISVGFCFMLLITLKGKALIDFYGYVAFYLFSLVESLLYLCLIIFKLINFIIIFQTLETTSCRNKYYCPGYFIYLLILIINLIIFFGYILYIKFDFVLFIDSFNILILKQKTFFQRQIEINEKESEGRKLEYVDDKDESINESFRQMNSKDTLKIN